MQLKKSFDLPINFNSLSHNIKIDNHGRICLNDLATFFPAKRLDNYRRLQCTKELIATTDHFLNTSHVSQLKVITTTKGKYNSGTYGHEIIATDFAMWLDPIFRVKVLISYTKNKEDNNQWNLERIQLAKAHELQCRAIEAVKDEAKPHHFMLENKMINNIVFGYHCKDIRDKATKDQLHDLTKLTSYNSGYLEQDMPYQERKTLLQNIHDPS